MQSTVADRLLGRVLDGRYRIEARIARGGMATVYRALDLRLDRSAAVKIMHPALAADPAFVARFRREARAAAKISSPHVVAVTDAGTDAELVFLVMEHIEGGTVRDLLHEQGAVSAGRALGLIDPVLAALGAAHRAGVVHRDVKPENILLADDGRVLVADFGLARAVAASSLAGSTGLLLGTPAYLAPELVTSGAADPRADVYSTGVVLFELLTGQVPHRAETAMGVAYLHVHHDVEPPSRRRPDLPAVLDDLILDMTARDPARRLPDAEAALQELRRTRRVVAQSPRRVVGAAPPDGTHPPRPASGSRAAAARPGDSEAAAAGEPGARPAPSRSDSASTKTTDPDRALPERSAPTVGFVPPDSGQPVPTSVLPRLAPGRSAAGGDTQIMPTAASSLRAPLHPGQQRGVAREHGQLTEPPRTEPPWTEPPRTDPGRQQRPVQDHPRADRPRRRRGQRTDPAPPAADRALTPRPRRRWRRRLLVLALVLLVSAAAGAGGWWFGSGRFTRVPALTGQTQEQAAASAAGTRVEVVVGDPRFDETLPPGQVVSQDPPAGARVLRGRDVTVHLSQGPQRFTTPGLQGGTVEQAQDLAKANNLTLVLSSSYSDTVPDGQVISQDPGKGTQQKRGDPVAVVVSSGRAPVQIPQVSGRSAADARKQLSDPALALLPNTVGDQFSDTVPAGNVISQDPPAGITVKRGTTVNLVLSKGPDVVTVGRYTGRPVNEAKVAVAADGLKAETSQIPGSNGSAVISQTPPQGSVVRRGTTVVLYLI